MKAVMKKTVEKLKNVQTHLTPSQKKELYFSVKYLERDESKKNNIINDCSIYCEACMVNHSLLITNDYRFVRVLSGRVWDVFQAVVSKTLNVEPVPLVIAEEIITGVV